MLVLTTMFINVSNNLPKTAYIKMIDIWLLFNLIKPFNDILVTTYMESLKVDDEREINHHGVARTVGNEDSGGKAVGVLQVAPMSRTPPANKYVLYITSKSIFSHNLIEQPVQLYFSRAELVNINEQKQREALKEFYTNEILKQKNEDRIKHLKKFSRVINPLFCVGFVIVFWAAGMQHYYKKL